MKIEIKQPHPDYPYAHAHVGIQVDTDGAELSDILASHRLTLLGPWTADKDGVTVKGFMAPVLLEDEHIKPRKKPSTKRK